MFTEEVGAAAKAAQAKVSLLKNNPLGYFLAAMLAGIYVGFGILLIFSIGGMLQGAAYTKIIMGVSFGIALSLVIIAGSELFTGNNMIMSFGLMSKTIRPGDAFKLWIVCWLGNLAGSMLLALLFWGAGFANGNIGTFIAETSLAKMTVPFLPLFLRGLLCNMLVCLAVWSAMRCKSESGKLIMIFWCLFAFITTGFEHSVANMTLLTVGLLAPQGLGLSLAGFAYNLLVVTLGNMVGGILLIALPYQIIASRKEVS